MHCTRRVYIILFVLLLSHGFLAFTALGDNAIKNVPGPECGTHLTPEDVIHVLESMYDVKGAELASKALDALNAPVGVPLAIHGVFPGSSQAASRAASSASSSRP